MQFISNDLPIFIASGILIASLIIFGVRFAFILHYRGETPAAIIVGLGACFLGTMVIMGGMGF